MSSAPPTKRHKDGPMGGPPPPDGYHGGGGYGPPGGRYQQPPYGGPGGPPMGPQSAYMGWQHGQYGGGGGPPPPHSWGGHASQPPPGPPGSMYPQRGGPPMTPDRPGYGAGYARGPPPPIQTPGRRGLKPAVRPAAKTPDGPAVGPPDGPPPPGGYQGGWAHPSQASQWGPQHQWGTGPPPPPPVYNSGPTMHQPPYGGGPGMYGGGSAHSPPRGGVSHPRASPEMMGSYPGAPMGGISQTVDGPEMDMYSRGVGPGGHDDDDNGSMAGGNSSKDKGRGSYKCGRCGVPKKGHVCPYQPKMTRRPGEPLPEMRGAAIQVEMDEFMTLRRLNLKIQGFPESYATEPYMDDDMVVGEPHPLAVSSSHAPPGGMTRGELMPMPIAVDGALPMGLPPQDTPMMGSPIRSSPVLTEDPIVA